MAQGLFVNFSISQILALQANAYERIRLGKEIMNYGDQGTSVGKQQTITPEKCLAECIYALKVKDPDTYGNVRDTRRVSASFKKDFPL